MDKCVISDDWSYKGMQTIFLENEYLSVGILADRGSDIFRFHYKPMNIDPLLRLEKGIQNPARHFSQIRDTKNQFEDYYYGGWQEILPNSPGFNYKGAVLGQHGEVSLIPWKYAIVEDSPDKVAVKLWTQPLRMPLKITKIITLKKGESKIQIDERLENLAAADMDIMWGHHIAFGLPFVKDEMHLQTNAGLFKAEREMPDERLIQPETEFEFPFGKDLDGNEVDISKIPDMKQKPYSELIYLNGFEEERAFYKITNSNTGLGFRVDWDARLFKSLWLWQERHGMQGFPWWGKAYTIALEPWTSNWTSRPEEAIAKGEWLKIKAGECIETQLKAGIE